MMFKALFHKQMLEIRRMYFFNKRKGTLSTTKSSITGKTILFIFLYLILAGSFYALSGLIGLPLLKEDLAWIFFMLTSIMAFVLGIFGSVLSSTSVLFKATDNEFLLAMPIPPSKILLSRMVSIYLIGLIYESIVMLPAVLFYFINGHPTILSVILSILGIFVLGFLVLVFSCFFGWIFALISTKLKNQKILTTIILAIVIAAFIYLRFQANTFFRMLAEHGRDIGMALQGWGYPIYSLGLGMSGDIIAFLIFTVMTAVLFVLTCIIMSKSFLRIVSTKSEAVRGTFSESQIRTKSVGSALRRKEFRRFTSSTAYMLNCGFGVLILLAATVILLIKMQDVNVLLDTQTFLDRPTLYVLGTFAVCLISSICYVASPSISLEGKSIWVLQTLPVDPYSVFSAKIFLHISIVGIPALLCTLALIIVLQPGVFAAICMLLCVAAFVYLSGSAMLALDLRRPMLDWTTEAQPIKQSLNGLLAWFVGMILAAVFGALYLLVGKIAGPEIYLLICILILAALSFLLHRWLKSKGRQLFAEL